MNRHASSRRRYNKNKYVFVPETTISRAKIRPDQNQVRENYEFYEPLPRPRLSIRNVG